VILAYNRIDELEKTIGHLAHQTFGDFEVCVIDNGSTDAVSGQIKGWPLSERTKVLRLEPNAGLTAINQAAKIAKGKYLVFLDDDAHLEPAGLKKLYGHIRSQKIECACPKVIQVNLPGVETDTPYYTEGNLKFAYYYNGSGYVISRETFEEILKKFGSLYDKQLHIGHTEFDASVKICKLGKSIAYFDDIITYHRKMPGNKNHDFHERKVYEFRNRLYAARKYVPVLRQVYVLPALLATMLAAAAKNGAIPDFLKALPEGLTMQTHERITPMTREELRRMTGKPSYLYLFVGTMWAKAFPKA